MNRNVLWLQFGVVLTVAAWLGTTSPQELLPVPESSAQFQVNLDQMSQSGGCLTEIYGPCPTWEDPNSEDVLCGCTGPNDESCSPGEAEGEDEEDATISGTRSWYNYEDEPGIGFGGSIHSPVVCTSFHTCQPGCIPNALGEGYVCNTEIVSGLGEADSYRGDPDNPVNCNVYFYGQLSREAKQSARLAMVSGIGLQLFSKE